MGPTVVAFLIGLGGANVCADGRPRTPQSGSLDASGVRALLAVMDSIASLHPGFAAIQVDRLPSADRDSLTRGARHRNESSPGLQKSLETLFETATYRSYFERFSNVTPELVRSVLLDLPFGIHPAPGGIAETYFALIRDRDSVRELTDNFVSAFDYDAMSRRALHWVPDGDYDLPTVHLIYDSNAGSFTANGSPFFNLYTERILAGAQHETSLAEFVDDAEGVMAHEVQHVLVRPLLYPDISTDDWPWRKQWVEGIVRGLVSEGLAAHCNPPSGMRAAVWEDPEVLAALVRSLEETLLAMHDGHATPESVAAWYRASFQEMPRDLLRTYLARDSRGADLETAMRRYASIRPDYEHALGWWMVSRISERGTRRAATLELLSDPKELFGRYNRTLEEQRSALRVREDVVQYVVELMR